MTITVFTSNQPRHIALIETLASISTRVFAVQECNTIFPGLVDDFFRKSPVMQDYFSRVMRAETEVFGCARFLPENVRSISMKMGDLSRIKTNDLGEALSSDAFVVFGASYIRGPLCELLVARKAINIHMGVSPYYRGSSTNFWAMFDQRPDLVGATIHRLSAGLDSGPILFHAFPKASHVDAFRYGMLSVRAAHLGLREFLSDPNYVHVEPASQDRSQELRYTRNADFTDDVANNYLQRVPDAQTLGEAIQKRDASRFIRPFFA